MNGVRPEGKQSNLLIFIGVVVIAGALHVAREVFIPIAVAALLSFLLAPLVKRLVRWGFPNIAAVLTTVGFAFVVLGVIAWLVSAQVVNLAHQLPNYQENMRAKISAVSEQDEGVFSRVAEMIGSLRSEIQQEPKEGSPDDRSTEPDPIAVRIEDPPADPLQLLAQYAGPVLGPLGLAGVSFIFVIFMLLQRNDIRERFVRLVSGGNLNLATQAVDDAAQRITRYLVMQMVINVTYGIPLGIGLYFIGVPKALLWGILATVLRFIPFVGPWIAAAFPISLAIAVDPGWTMALMVIGLVVSLELISNNMIEPWLYGTSTGISIIALLVAALVWTWIWGPVGLFLSTPLTVCLLVLGRNVPSLGFLNVMLGSEPVLAPEARLYQRMLSMDSESVFDMADEHVKSHSLADFYDRLLVPALAMAERDRHAGALAERRQHFILQSTRDLIEDFGDRLVKPVDESSQGGKVLCLPADDEADELTALMLSQLLAESGVTAESVSTAESIDELVARTRTKEVKAVCICAVPPEAIAGARRKCRRLRKAGIEGTLVVAIWDFAQDSATIQRGLATTCHDFVATTFTDARSRISKIIRLENK